MIESKLSPKIPDSELTISGYETFGHNRTRKGGGVLIYCRQILRPKAIIDPKPTLEALAIKLQLTLDNSMIICGVYHPPSSDAMWMNEFFAYLSQLSVLHSRIVIASDFNVDLLTLMDLYDELQKSFGLIQLIRSPTRVNPTSATLIDHIYLLFGNIMHAGIFNMNIVDHYAVYCCLDGNRDKASGEGRHVTQQFRCFKKLDTQALLSDLRGIVESHVSNLQDVNSFADEFTTRFCNV